MAFVKIITSLFLVLISTLLWAQNAEEANPDLDLSAEYVVPQEADVRAKLSQWEDLKFGMIIHWGIYAVPGIVESWSICSEDEEWIPRDSTIEYNSYKNWYWGLSEKFNPTAFNPEQWAETAADAGMKYVVFTTKHHDGFAMYDTRYSDYSIAKGPFANHPKRDVARHVFDAFRNQNMMIGAYYSKPDWHSQDYWWNRYATPDRHVNYTISKHPERWNNFKQFVYNQIDEITSNYGNIDILWLDGGWVRAPKEDIDMERIATMARQNQPGLIIVDRTVQGAYENYRTPEKMVPEQPLDYPWETCIPLSKDWGFVPGATFKSAQEIIAMLTEVVAKGGSLLLGVGPTPEGVIEPEVVKILGEIGEWLERNGKAIYGTRATDHYREENIWFTASPDRRTHYAIVEPTGASTISWHKNLPDKGSKMVLLSTQGKLNYKLSGDSVIVTLPQAIRNSGEPFAILFQTQGTLSFNDLNKNGKCDPYENPQLPIEERVEDLIQQMTIEEKVGQLAMTMGWEYYQKENSEYTLTDLFKQAVTEKKIGSTWAVMRADPWTQKTLQNGLTPEDAKQVTQAMQRWVRENTRLGIPLLFAEECPHGHMAIGTTVLPTALGRASTFNPDLEYELGKWVADECSAQGGHLAFGPVLDISRDFRWSRVEENYGECPTLTATMGSAYARGLQSDDRMAATLKHLSAYGISEGGHNGATAQVGRQELLSALSYPFQVAVNQGARAVMTAYNDIDGTPCSANSWLLKKILRKEWGFNGIVISDLFAIDGLVSGRVAADKSEAAAAAVNAGVNIDLGGSCYSAPLLQALQNQLVSEAQIDELLRPVLALKFELQLFDQTFDDKKTTSPQGGEALAKRAAEESIILLKNENKTLPLSKNLKNIVVVGPNADNIYNMLGDYTAPQPAEEVITLLQGIQREVPNANISYYKGCAIRDTTHDEIEQAVAAARNADVIIVALGGSSARDFKTDYEHTGAANAQSISDMDSGEGFDRASLSMMGKQETLLKALAEIGKPVVLVMIQGRPLDLTWADAHVPAILNAWYPGARGGEALARILFGDVNPSGRLPISYPKNVGQLPVYYNSYDVRRDYTDASAQPLYPFGFGLSYTQFQYSALEPAKITEEGVSISFTLSNTGDCDGAEVAQLYIRDEIASVKTPERQLKQFQKIFLKKGESKRVTFTIPRTDFAILNNDLQWVTEPGKFTLMIGSSSQEIHLQSEIEFR